MYRTAPDREPATSVFRDHRIAMELSTACPELGASSRGSESKADVLSFENCHFVVRACF